MINISNELREKIIDDSQELVGKVDIIFADSRHLDNISSSVTPEIEGFTDDYSAMFKKEQAFNGLEEETFSWAIANGLDSDGDVITANGNFYTIPDKIEQNIEFGWWTNSLSDASGIFVTPETLEIIFDDRLANKVRFTTSYSLGRIKGARLSYKDTSNTWHNFDVELDPEEWEYEWSLESEIIIRGLRIRVDSTHNPEDIGRVHELIPVFSWEFDDDDIINWNIDEVRENTDLTLPIGTSAVNTMSLTLDNTDKRFNPDGNSEFSEYMQGDIIIKPYIGWEINNEIEYIPFGEFYADDIDTSSEMTVTISCRDYSKYFQDEVYEDGAFYENIIVGQAIADTAKLAGFPNRKIKFYDRYWNTIKKLKAKALWKFNDSPSIDDINDEYDNNVIHDEYGSHNGILVYSSVSDIELGDTSLMPGYDESSINFNGVSGSYATVPHSSDITLIDEFTITGLVKIDSLPSAASVDGLIVKGNNTDYNYALYVDDVGRLHAATKNSANTVTYDATSEPLDLGESYFFAMKYDASDNKIHLFLNSEETLSSTVASIRSNSDALIFGRLSSGTEINGNLQAIAFFDKALSEEQINKLFIESQLDEIYNFPYLYMIENSFWDGMIEWSTADLGTFYLDRYGYLNYEYRNTLHEENIERFSEIQYSFSDDEDIISGSRIGQVQSNKVIVVINPITSINSDYQNIWRAEDGESLVVTKAVEILDDSETGSLKVISTNNPLWLNSGYFKIDDEIIKYNSKSGNKLIGLTRGMFNTTPANHGVYTYTFESGGQGWRKDRNIEYRVSENESHSGTKSLLIEFLKDDADAGTIQGPGGKNGLMHGSDDVTITGWVYSEDNIAPAKIGIKWFNEDGETISIIYGSQSNTTLSSWKQYSVTDTPPSNSKYFTPIFYIDGGEDEIFYIDDINCTGIRSKVREARYYDIEYDQVPAINVKYPFLTAVIFDKTVEIDSFEADRFKAKLLISAKESVAAGSTIVLEGTDPTTELDNFFAIAGIPLVEESATTEIEEYATENSGAIRRHRIKELTIDNRFIQNKVYAETIASFLIEHFKNEVPILNIQTIGVPQLELGDRIEIAEFDQLDLQGTQFWILSNSIAYDGGLSMSMMLREVS